MKGLDRWKLADELNVLQISLLVAGYDPADFAPYEQQWPPRVRQEVTPFLSAIKNAAKSEKIKFKKEMTYAGDTIDWQDSTVEISSLVTWLQQRNFADGFFIPTGTAETSGILNPDSPFYAIKLAAAVRAWTEVTSDPALLAGKSPKKALEVWLRKHANEYGLTGKDGNPNNLGIEEISKVANWKPAGGATPTPFSTIPATPPPRMGRKVPSEDEGPFGRAAEKSMIIDDDIPF